MFSVTPVVRGFWPPDFEYESQWKLVVEADDLARRHNGQRQEVRSDGLVADEGYTYIAASATVQDAKDNFLHYMPGLPATDVSV